MMFLSYPVEAIALFLFLGAAAGFLGGLIGIGGGFVLVPGLMYYFHSMPEYQEHAMALTLGTTMASIFFVGLSSGYGHFKRNAVEWTAVKKFTPTIGPFTAVGALLATVAKVAFIKLFFGAFCLYSACRMLFFAKTLARAGAEMATAKTTIPGAFFGTTCGLLGVGGANMFVSFMVKHNVELRNAMATASVLQLPIAAVGTTAYILLGMYAGEPKDSLGYVFLPALLTMVPTALLCAQLGVKATHALPVGLVKKVFAYFTAAVGIKMLMSISI